ncbi:endonuclease [Tropicibacter oceani]|uniref:Endonuclease n=1 Tax=Tropicibacter oceani TaxID=3058420 RepID=A0ABY8QDJ1_9RHOB|nr:endonuclease [Tropicibacter oceani]WGW02560.1 endonuclease [Tropicibacter oceani]
MSDNTGGTCAMKCWGTAAILGLFVLILTADKGLFPALVLGLLTLGGLGLLFTWLFCAPVAKLGEGQSRSAGSGAAPAASAAVARSGAGSASGAVASGSAAASSAAAAATPKPEPVTKPAADAAKAEDSAEGAKDSAADDEAAASEARDVATAEASASVITASKPLAGQEELATRKGSWKYEGEAAADAKPAKAKPAAKSKPKAKVDKTKADKPKAKAAKATDPAPSGADQDNVDRDGDGKIEGVNEGSKPEMLTGPRAGGADNLKEIKGIGPKLEKLCNSLGVYHFDQIAAWTSDELAWVDSNLAGFRGRATRDDWVGQAKVLAAGGETEFSKRVEGGKVY